MGGDPLLKLIAVDWFKVDKSIDRIALHPKSLVQSGVGKKLPFILVINLQVVMGNKCGPECRIQQKIQWNIELIFQKQND
ncbi:hypothetical protein ACB092_07G164000 [Castanea dentata]